MDHPVNDNTKTLSRGTAVALWSLAIGLGIIRAWTWRHHMTPDGVSYLDMGDAFWRGDWRLAVNAYWSPLYSWLTGLALRVFHPSHYWEFATVQAVNFAVYVGILPCFGFFWREVLAWQQSRSGESPGEGIPVWPEWSWMLLGYTIAVWAALRLITVEATNPDMLLAGFVCLASGLVVRIRRGLATWSNFALLGLVLGLGYLAKSPMFPLAFVFLGVAMLSAGEWRKGTPRALLALAVFLVVAGPLVMALSLSRGHFTFGESGRVNYLMLYEGRPWWATRESGDGPKEDLEAPLPVEIPTLKGITYLPFYDHTRLSTIAAETPEPASAPREHSGGRLRRYANIWKRNVIMYYDIFLLRQGYLVAGALILFLLGSDGKSSVRRILQNWPVLVPACTALGAYALLVVEPRYVGPFIPVLWGGILPAIRLRDSAESKKLMNSMAVVAVILCAIQLCGFVGQDAAKGPGNTEHPQWEVAQSLQRLGLRPGDKVGVVGRGQQAYWARLGHFSIAAEILPTEVGEFWSAGPESRKRSLEAFSKAGAKAVVAQSGLQRYAVPEDWQHRAVMEGWQRFGDTGLYVYVFPR